MATLSPTHERVYEVQASSELTNLYLTQFKRMLLQQSAEIDLQRQNQYSLARHFHALAQKRFAERRLLPNKEELVQLLTESMRSHQQQNTAEPAVLTMRVTEAIVRLVIGTLDMRIQPRHVRDFLEESGILALHRQETPSQVPPSLAEPLIVPPPLIPGQGLAAAAQYRLR